VPKVFEKDGFRFFFYTNEHPPIHVHVRYGGGEAVFNVGDEVELTGIGWPESARARKSAEAC
jgi:hypothetical protein